MEFRAQGFRVRGSEGFGGGLDLLDDIPNILAGGSFLESVELVSRKHEALVMHVARTFTMTQNLQLCAFWTHASSTLSPCYAMLKCTTPQNIFAMALRCVHA